MCNAVLWTLDIRQEKNENEKATLISENMLAIQLLMWNEALLDYLLPQNTLLLNQMALYELQTTLSNKL
jgi:hypothetical protein